MMIKELLPQEKVLEVHDKMQHPELSLGFLTAEADTKTSKKRKFCFDQSEAESMIQTSIELQAQESLPLDWEQCLDLESGRMYYVNRKTMKKSWKWPKGQKLDLELNISTPSSTDDQETKNEFEIAFDRKKPGYSNSSNMVAVACMKCHLLVMLCRSSPSCPNCKYVHSLLPSSAQETLVPSHTNFKPFNTLSLLN